MNDPAAVTTLGLLFGGVLGGAFLFVGVRLRYHEAYGWVAGYNTASAEEQQRYDIEGLAHHLGNGLMTLGVLIIAAAIALHLQALRWFSVTGILFFGAIVLIVAGGYKFRPRRSGEPPFVTQRVLQILVPARAFSAIERGTRQWVIECKCGLRRDYWEAGGIRYKAVGDRRMFAPCESCRKITWQKVTKLPTSRT